MSLLVTTRADLSLDGVRSKNSKGNQRLAALTKRDRHFAAAVALPGGARKGGYRIRSLAEARALIDSGGQPAPAQAKSEPVSLGKDTGT